MKIYADLWLTGPDLDPDEITKATGLYPDVVYRRGQLMPSRRPREEGLWSVQTRESPRETIEEALDDLFGRLEAGWDGLVEVAHGFRAGVCAVVMIDADDPSPAIFFRPSDVAKAAALGAALEVDDYDDRLVPSAELT